MVDGSGIFSSRLAVVEGRVSLFSDHHCFDFRCPLH